MLKLISNTQCKEHGWHVSDSEKKNGYLANTVIGDQVFIPAAKNYKAKFNLTGNYDVSNSRVFKMSSGRKSISHNKIRGWNQLLSLIHLVLPNTDINENNLIFKGVSVEFKRIIHHKGEVHIYLWVSFENPTGYVASLHGKKVFVVNWKNGLDIVRIHDFQMMQKLIIDDADHEGMLNEYDKAAKVNSAEVRLINNSYNNAKSMQEKLKQLKNAQEFKLYSYYFTFRNLVYYYTKKNFEKVAS
tara:strand:+ start:1380 stop:2108 length:729 start_codon:yes stop_codon:yes gene_type:complete